VRVSVPPENGCVHEFVPEYEPLSVSADTDAVPFVVIVHAGDPLTLPAGTVSVHVRFDPERLPEIVPVESVVRDSVETVAVPVTLLPLCVSVQVMSPGPEESLASPDHVPVSP
jgi:hypothetical protein